jgi:hypothetical protein
VPDGGEIEARYVVLLERQGIIEEPRLNRRRLADVMSRNR